MAKSRYHIFVRDADDGLWRHHITLDTIDEVDTEFDDLRSQYRRRDMHYKRSRFSPEFEQTKLNGGIPMRNMRDFDKL